MFGMNFFMLSRSQNLCGRVALMRSAVLTVHCSMGTFAAAQDQHPPKWELFGGYSYFYPGAGLHGMLPGGLLPVGSRLESNPQLPAPVSLTASIAGLDYLSTAALIGAAAKPA